MARTGRCTGFCLDASAGGSVSATGGPTTGGPTGGWPPGGRVALSRLHFGVLLALRLRVLVESNPVAPAPEAGWIGETGASPEGRRLSFWPTMLGWRKRGWLRTPPSREGCSNRLSSWAPFWATAFVASSVATN